MRSTLRPKCFWTSGNCSIETISYPVLWTCKLCWQPRRNRHGLCACIGASRYLITIPQANTKASAPTMSIKTYQYNYRAKTPWGAAGPALTMPVLVSS